MRKMTDKAILDGHKVVLMDTSTHEGLMEWAGSFEYTNRTVARTVVNGVLISTVFLGVDHNLFGEAPHWFETMIFYAEGGRYEDYEERYTTWEQAEAGHKKAVAFVKGEVKL